MTSRTIHQRAQVLVFFALALPLVLLPIAAYAVDASVAASAYSRLLEVTTRAAEEAAQQIDITGLRSGDAIAIDPTAAIQMARRLVDEADPEIQVDAASVVGQVIRLTTTETVVLPFDFVGSPRVALHATVAARIAPGYDSPSSLLPLSTRIF